MCCAMWLWTKSTDRDGSTPPAMNCAAVRRVRSRSTAGSGRDGQRVQVGDEVEGVVGLLQPTHSTSAPM